jgi:hypothetical protein
MKENENKKVLVIAMSIIQNIKEYTDEEYSQEE